MTKDRLSEATARLQGLQEEVERERREVEALREDNRNLDRRVHEAEKAGRAQEVQAAALEQQVRDKDDALSRTTEHLRSAEKQKVEEETKRDKRKRKRQKNRIKKERKRERTE